MRRFLAIILSVMLVLNNVHIVYASDTNVTSNVISDVELPFSYTEIYTAKPASQFYSKLYCKVDDERMELDGFTWEAPAEYGDGKTAGTYTFAAVAPEGYQFAKGETPTITVRVKGVTYITNRGGTLFSKDTNDSENISGTYAMFKAGSTANMSLLYDITGCTVIDQKERTAGAKIAGGVDYATYGETTGTTIGDKYAANPTDLTAQIGVEGTTIASLFGGSYCNIFKGTSNIYVKDGVLVTGVFAGSLNGTFDGKTNIHISGNSTIPNLYLGSIYQEWPAVNRSDVSYNGEINVYIAENFTGTITEFNVAAGEDDNIAANIYISGNPTGALPATMVSGGNVKVYRDNVLIPNTVTAVNYDGETSKVMKLGTDVTALGFGDTLELVCGNATYVEKGITWVCDSYDANVAGTYVFKPVIPDHYRVDESLLPTVSVQIVEGDVMIQSVGNLPFTYTEIYKGVSAPQFYDTLTCTVEGASVEISEFTWESTDYQSNTAGTYTFTAVAPEGYQFAEDMTIPTITVRVKESTAVKNRSGVLISNHTDEETPISGMYGVFKPGTTKANQLYDITGFIKIDSAERSNGARIVGGVDYAGTVIGDKYAADPTNLTAKIRVENGADVKAVFGGSYGNIFKGTTDIYIDGGTVNEGIYAGGFNGDFEGNTNIYLSGNSSIAKIYLGSYYDNRFSVGETEVSYNGTINVYIAEDFTGTIGALEVAAGAGDMITANIYLPNSDAVSKLPAIVNGSKVNLYIDNVAVSKEATSVVYEGENPKHVNLGTDVTDISFDDTLNIQCGDVTYVENGITWTCDNYDANVAGNYVFTPVVPECYVVSNITLPAVTVSVEAPKTVIQAVETLPFTHTEIYIGASVSQFYDTLTCTVEGASVEISGFTWESTDYQSNTAGTYTFTAVAPDGYKFADDMTIPTITVRVKESTAVKNRSGVLISNHTDEETPISGMYGVFKPGTTKANQLYDITGFIKIDSAERSNGARIVGGVDYAGTVIGDKYAADPTNLTAKIRVENGADVKAVFGGSYGNIFKGTTDIYIDGGTVNEGIYAGGFNGDFEGNTNIYLSGNSSIAKIYLGSYYDNRFSVGETEVSYNGTINVYIAEDFTGTIGAMEAANGAGDVITANIYLPNRDAVSKLPPIVSGSKVKLYINNEEVQKEVTAVTYDGQVAIQVNMETAAEDIDFSGMLEIVCGDVIYVEKDIVWTCESYDANTAGDYVFTTTIPECYLLGDVTLPTVTVQVIEPKGTIQGVDLPFAYTEIYKGVTDPVFYDTLTCTIDDEEISVSGFTWTSLDYRCDKAGTYTFTINAPIGYKFADDMTIPTITVRVRDASSVTNRGGTLVAKDADDPDNITGAYAVFKKGIDNTSKSRLYDITGFNVIDTQDRTTGVKVIGGVDYASYGDVVGTAIGDKYAANPTELTAQIGVDGTTVSSLFGGSYCNIFKGTSNLYVKSGRFVSGIYAGSLNGDFEGITNIYISGNSSIPELYLGSVYEEWPVVNRQDVSYKGTINVYIADDFNGDIGKIIVPNGERDQITRNEKREVGVFL